MTTILGLKISHDAAIALVRDNRLEFCVELEKVANGARYTKMNDLGVVARVLRDFGYALNDVDHFVIDGWKHGFLKHPRDPALRVPVAGYHEFSAGAEPVPLLTREVFPMGPLEFGPGQPDRFSSYRHIAGHLIGTYAMSPWAGSGKPVLSLTWDGGQQPRMHLLDPETRTAKFLGTLHELYGIMYGIVGYYFGPYKKKEVINGCSLDEAPLFGGYETPGKLMSYIALGKVNEGLHRKILQYYIGIEKTVRSRPDYLGYHQSSYNEHMLCRLVLPYVKEQGISDEDALATFHHFQEDLLVRRAVELSPPGLPLLFSGGSALNIKWNTALRESRHFADVWVPPVPNDCGSAIGAAACENYVQYGEDRLLWSVYCGPRLPVVKASPPGWRRTKCTVAELAQRIVTENSEPFVVLHGRAEIGPRALGHRSIFMSAERAANKDILNTVKRRERFRPVAPICLERYAQEIFYPGTHDPFMLFDHEVRPAWRSRVPAIVHLDGTARLQTINARECPVTAELLEKVHELSGIPLLCNTSANRLGAGFFPDVESAAAWAAEAGVNYIWASEELYTRA